MLKLMKYKEGKKTLVSRQKRNMRVWISFFLNPALLAQGIGILCAMKKKKNQF